MKIKNLFITLSLFAIVNLAIAQTGNVGIGTASPDASAILDVNSTTKGLLIPRVSIGSASTFGLAGTTNTAGMMVYNINASITGGYGIGFYYWTGSTWTRIANGKVPATLSNGKIWIGDASNDPLEQTLSGDVTISNTGVATIQDNSVDGTDIALGSDATGDLMYYNGTDWVRLASGTTGQILQANGAAAPSWSARTAILNSQNGLSTVTTGGSATATTPYVELGGTLYKGTTVTQGANTLAFTSTATNGFSVDGSTFSVDAANDRIGVGTAAPGNKLSVNGTIEAIDFGAAGSANVKVGDDAFLSDVDIANTMSIQSSSNTAIGALQLGSNAASYIYGAGGNIGVGTTTLNAKLDVNGILAMNDYAIRLRPGTDANHQIIFNSTVDGPSIEGCSGIQFKKNCTAEILGTWNTTALDVQNSQIYAREGIKTRKSYQYFRSMADEDDAWTKDLGNWDICYLAGVSMYMDNNVTWDIDNQCNVYPSYNTLDDYWSDGGSNNTLYSSSVETVAYNTKLPWKL